MASDEVIVNTSEEGTYILKCYESGKLSEVVETKKIIFEDGGLKNAEEM